MKFRGYQLVIDEGLPGFEDLKPFIYDIQEHFDLNGYHYHSTKEFVDKRFLWVSTFFDDGNLYSEQVYNQANQEDEKNPRRREQLELRHQMFFCYDLNKHRLYLTDETKKAFIKGYMGESIQLPIRIKPIVVDLDAFIAHLRELRSISFVQEDNLCNRIPGEIFDRQVNALGLDLPERLKVKLEYGHLPHEKARTVLQNLKKMHQKAQFQNLIAIGIDDQGLEECFDFRNMLTTVDIATEKDDDGHYDCSEVKESFIQKILELERLENV